MPGDREPETSSRGADPAVDDADRSLLGRIMRARERPRSPLLLVAALGAFVAFTVVGFANLPHLDKPVRWELIALAAVVFVPLVTALNALEFRLMGRLVEHRPPILEILQVTVLGSAANLLPVPGAVVVRIANLRKGGVKVGRGLNLTAIVGLAWVGAACLLGGLVQIWSHPGFAAAALAAGAGLLGVSFAMLVRILEPGTRTAAIAELLAIELAFILAQAFRLFLIAAALRLDASFAQTTTLAIAAVVAAAIGFLPSGLGAREAIAALLAPVVGLPVAVGLVITAVDRIVSLVVLSLLAGAITLTTRRDRRVRRA